MILLAEFIFDEIQRCGPQVFGGQIVGRREHTESFGQCAVVQAVKGPSGEVVWILGIVERRAEFGQIEVVVYALGGTIGESRVKFSQIQRAQAR